ncbi:disease resistance protein RPV1 [Trifolium repens]|nr:disease resistance protein RPV1 [Trifolium repens]
MASVAHGFLYDVFLSFRGEDTRHGFTGNLKKALDDHGVRTFMDDDELRKGDEITPSLLQAIEDSKIAIVVLSKNYASSSFCLEELSKILDSIKDKVNRSVLPVFYKVDPSDIRKLQKSYGEAIAKHMANSNPNIDKWKMSLQQVANLSGFHYKKGEMYEHEFIGKIVEEVSKKITVGITLHVGDYLVGLEPQKQRVISLLNVGSDDTVHMVGIHGIGGIGKTTLALEVYNSIIHQFQCSCFLKVRENYHKNGLELQKILLSQIVEKKIDINSVEEGIPILIKMLSKKKVLLLLDDVDNEKQLQDIAGNSNWFGNGSRVIITTRNQRLLTLHGVEAEHTYEVKELNNKDAFELVKWKAFKNEKTVEVFSSYVHVLKRAVAYASGLPLALEVIGSHFSNRTIEECKCALDRCERVLDEKIQMTLQLSFDGLEEEEKFVFLDIACCLKGYELRRVEQILNAHHGYSIKNHINVLLEKSLIKISESVASEDEDEYKGVLLHYVTLHDLVEDMGKNIVKQESPNPWERSRLWASEDINEALKENKEKSKIGIIYVNNWINLERDGEAFNKMENLKTLLIDKRCHFDGSLKHLPNSLRVLDCRQYLGLGIRVVFPNKASKFQNMRVLNFDFESLEDHLFPIHDLSNLPNLEELSIKNCWGKFTSDKPVCLSNLKILRFIRYRNVSVPPLNCPSLVELDLSYCYSLESFPSTVNGFAGNLKILRLKGCSKIRIIPLHMLHSLEELNLNDCTSLESFSHVVGMGEKLKTMSVIHCIKLRSIPPLKLTSLEEIDLSYCPGLESFPLVVDEFLGKLKTLLLDNCHNLKSIPPLKLDVLEKLDLSNCYMLESFPLVVGEFLGKLKTLRVKNCQNLKSIPPLKLDSLEILDLSDCTSLESFPLVVGKFLGKLKSLRVENCHNLKSIPPLKLDVLEELDFSCCFMLESFPLVVGEFLGKLKTLRVKNCHNLKSIPPLKLDVLEELDHVPSQETHELG